MDSKVLGADTHYESFGDVRVTDEEYAEVKEIFSMLECVKGEMDRKKNELKILLISLDYYNKEALRIGCQMNEKYDIPNELKWVIDEDMTIKILKDEV